MSQAQPRQRSRGSRVGRSDSDFEAEVAVALRDKGYTITQQHPACGFFIDMVLEREGQRLAVECDGEQQHLDEHGQLKIEDLERQAILERAGWEVLRIPYRRWRERQEEQLDRIDDWFAKALFNDDDCGDHEGDQPEPPDVPAPKPTGDAVPVTLQGEAIIQALRAGIHEETQVFRRCLPPLGYQKLGNRIRSDLGEAGRLLQRAGLIAIEEEEYFLTAQGRAAQTYVAQVQTYFFPPIIRD